MKHKPHHVILAILGFIFITLPTIVVNKLVVLLGLIIVPLVLPFSKKAERPFVKYRPELVGRVNTYDGWEYERLPYPFHYIWGSDTYGNNGNWIFERHHPVSFWRKFDWLAVRNAASNWGYLPFNRYMTEGKNIRYFGTALIDDNKGLTGWRFTYDVTCPWRSGFVILLRYGKSERGLWWRMGWLQDPTRDKINPNVKGMIIPHFFKKIPKQ